VEHNLTLAASTSSVIDSQVFSGSGRSLKLNGVLTESGNVTFKETGVTDTFNSDDQGFVLTANNTMSGTVTIGGATENGFVGRLSSVRVGGSTAANDAAAAGASGSLGSGAVVNNGTLTFSRNNAHTVANIISGNGSLRIGSAGITGTGTQAVTLTGANTYTGATTIANGTLITGHASALGNGSAAVTVNGGVLQIGNGTANSVTLGAGANLVIANGATLKFFAADSAIGLQGAGSYTLGNSTLDLNGAFNAAGTYHLISGGNSGAGTQGTLSFSNFDNTNFTAAFASGDLVVTAVPEPSTYGLIGAGALAAVAFVHRRRKVAGRV
jgi:autotransporter-associated beta strand protein